MSEKVLTLKKKIKNGRTLGTIAKTLKVLAAMNRQTYQKIVGALEEYDKTIKLGFIASHPSIEAFQLKKTATKKIGAVIFGSDLGLVGQFNDLIADYAAKELKQIPGKKTLWVVGEIIDNKLRAFKEFEIKPAYRVPISSKYILPLLTQLQSSIDEEIRTLDQLLIFYNETEGSLYKPTFLRLLPLDKNWLNQFETQKWPTRQIPELVDGLEETFLTLIKEYLFIEIYRICAKSLFSENSARFLYMKMAEKKIQDHLQGLQLEFNHARQDTIDRELADILSGFEALKAKKKAK
jgi:F-type H+-transporting ATPase subunit gamma